MVGPDQARSGDDTGNAGRAHYSSGWCGAPCEVMMIALYPWVHNEIGEIVGCDYTRGPGRHDHWAARMGRVEVMGSSESTAGRKSSASKCV